MSTSLFSKKLKEGSYRAVLLLNPDKGIELPFIFSVKYTGKTPVIIIQNADERIVVEEIKIKGDSVNFKMPVYDTEFKCLRKGNDLEGYWINNYKTTNNKIKFKATYGETQRFLASPEQSAPAFEGKWEVTFSPQSKDSSKAIGLFHHEEGTSYLSGTFLTETGDYRYLEGIKKGNQLYLSCFDGSHAFLFTAELSNNTLINGKFYSGSSWEENWVAKRNAEFKLADPEEISFLNNKEEKINFSFPDLNGNVVSLSDKRYENKPVIVQLMGSWCPNCKDESTYLSSVYKQFKDQGLEIIALAFEKTSDFEKAKAQVSRMQKKLNIEYNILITQQIGKDKAGETLALNKVVAFPTTLFLNKEHKVVKVHSGFSGPATGAEFEVFKQRTENLIKSLLKE